MDPKIKVADMSKNKKFDPWEFVDLEKISKKGTDTYKKSFPTLGAVFEAW